MWGADSYFRDDLLGFLDDVPVESFAYVMVWQAWEKHPACSA